MQRELLFPLALKSANLFLGGVITADQIKMKNKPAWIMPYRRFIAAWLLKANMTSAQAAHAMGRSDHTTVLHNSKSAWREWGSDWGFSRAMRQAELSGRSRVATHDCDRGHMKASLDEIIDIGERNLVLAYQTWGIAA